MKSLKKHSVLVLILGTSTLLAQPAQNAPTPDKPTPDAPKGRLSVEEIVKSVPTLLTQAEQDDRKVVILQIKARREKDVIKLNCINDKLLQIRALRNAMEKFLPEGNVDQQNERFKDLTNNVSSVRGLREQAQVCAGEGELQSASSSGYTGPDIPDDPGKDLFPDGVEPPGYASPYH